MTDETTEVPRLDSGIYRMDAPCPQCGAVEELLVKIGVAVTIPDDDVGTIRAKLKGKARDHDCRQDRLSVEFVNVSTGEVS